MKKTLIYLFAATLLSITYAQAAETTEEISEVTVEEVKLWQDSIENNLQYERGIIELSGGVAKLNLPADYKFLNAEQAQYVLTDLWGNPEDESVLGLIVPDNQGIFFDEGYVFEVYYSEIGYVKDNDADKIDYDDLLKDLQQETADANKERETAGYAPVTLVGWASEPYYDKDRKVLHWAKELEFSGSEVNTLNYNVRFLGRKGVFVANAIADITQLSAVQEDMPKIMDMVQFNDGYRYQDFDPSIDDVAKWTVGGLVAGKVLAKVGFFALIAKFWKVIAVAVIGFFGVFWKRIRRKNEDENLSTTSKNEDSENGKDER